MIDPPVAFGALVGVVPTAARPYREKDEYCLKDAEEPAVIVTDEIAAVFDQRFA